MTVTIFTTRASTKEEWLYVDDDGTVVHQTKNEGWTRGKTVRPRDLKMSPEEAKRRWPVYVAKIEEALASLKK